MLEDAETKIFIQYRNITYLDVCYMDNSLEHHDKSSEGEETALDLHLNRTVVKVANPTSQLQFPAEIKWGVTEAHMLDFTMENDVPPGGL